ncbi:cation diffusion facilitator family transporter [Fluviicola taffensis]|uniref:Cation diffusion facilitator family transporter n=1 Tax=Fluviicola taffensis (strain DSM 16823 / NCIMB 13979 / RW262) TaxID=755732 RepID=F2IHE4_FLUTR|nr:cation diffusion facilitator family transporter [Fluviicola taffensis]AEA43709.1 cation diffusion facilitator family transporter [Fluviicola taffensis DSM 16823]
MGHDHADHHEQKLTKVNSAFVVGIVLNLLFVIIEAIVGIAIDSLSVLSDAGHNLADVGTLVLSLLAFKLTKVKPTNRYTYGYRKTTILVALFNSLLLLLTIGAIIFGAIEHLFHPQKIPGLTVSIIAGIGIVINFTTALFFFRNKEKDINVKSAYLHLLADALVSVGLVIAGIAIYYTHLYWLDSIFSLIIAAIILVSTWKLMKESLRLSLDGVPSTIHLEEIETKIQMVNGVKEVYHIHIWPISSTENALTAHLVIEDDINGEQEAFIKHEIRHLLEHQNIQHVTLETEREDCRNGSC